MLLHRNTQESDRTQISKWIEEDVDHKGRVDADFFMPHPAVKTFVVEDSLGPVFYVRGENVLRLHIQFAPPSEKRRTARAIDEFTTAISAGAKSQNYKQIIFESVFEPLINFLHKRGFRSSLSEQVLDL